MVAPSLAEVVDILHEIAPLELAAEWDNVGLLLQPQPDRRKVARALLTVDLSAAVVAEAKRVRAELVVAYHPPIFKPNKRLGCDDAQQRALLSAITNGLAVYSPHTALDAAPSGLADWLVEVVLAGEVPVEVRPTEDGEFGRVVALARPLGFSRLLRRLKQRFAVRHLQVARPPKAKPAVRTVAVAAGAGGNVLRFAKADVFVTGEMSHHDTLAAVANGTSVVLAGHSNSERGFLKVLQRRLRSAFDGDLDVRIAASDRDPFVVV